jgi:hypothetical protein
MPNGEFGTVERANDEDAVVKWDKGGRIRIHQPFLKKVWVGDQPQPANP